MCMHVPPLHCLTSYFIVHIQFQKPNKSLEVFSRDSHNQTILFIKSTCAYIVARHEQKTEKCVLN